MLILIKSNKQSLTMKRKIELIKGLGLYNVVAYQCFGL